MAYSDTTTIRNALVEVIKGLTPYAPVYRRAKYQLTRFSSWDDKPGSDIDREFFIGEITGGLPLMFGAIAEIDYVGEMTVQVGHVISSDRRECTGRLNRDMLQIKQALEKKANFPTGVSLIRNSAGWVTAENPEKGVFVSEMEFEITYALAAP